MTLLHILVMEIIPNTSWDPVMINVGLAQAHPLNLQTTSLHKDSKGNLADIGMAQCMNALADKVHKQEVPCTQ